jgi:hypothetical protein
MNHGTPPTPAFTQMLSPTSGSSDENTRSNAGDSQ